MEHIFVYGEGNKYRMTGTHETAHYDVFSYKVGGRGCSVRIPVTTAETNSGYYEDRRPASNINPYISTAILVDTTILNGKYCQQIIKEYKDFKKAREKYTTEVETA